MAIGILTAISAAAFASATLGKNGTLGQKYPGCDPDDEASCSLLGRCHIVLLKKIYPYGVCECDPGWGGEACGFADFKDANLTLGYANATEKSWGGNVLRHEDGKTHSLYVSQFSNGCPLCLWYSNSKVVRTESTTGPGGPYTYKEDVYAEFHHNPTVVGPTSDGYYLMYLIGTPNAQTGTTAANCASGVPSPLPDGCHEPKVTGQRRRLGMLPSEGHISMGYAKSPTGPWSEPRVVLKNYDRPGQNQSGWDCFVTNPSVTLLPNSSEVMMVFSSVPCNTFSEALGSAFAPHWNATYVQSKDAIWIKPDVSNEAPPLQGVWGVGNVEDPFVWRDARGNFHIVAHSQGNTNVCDGDGALGHTAGVHFFATSKLGPWTPSIYPVYCSEEFLAPPKGTPWNGTTVTFSTRQRPQIVFSEDGLMTPRYMFNGGSFDGYNTDPNVHERTFAFEFNN